jgi:hypothetical protein
MDSKEQRNSVFAVFVVLLILAGYVWYSSHNKAQQEPKELPNNYQFSNYKPTDSISTEEIVGYLLVGDSCYHNTFHPMDDRTGTDLYNYTSDDIPNLRFVTIGEVTIGRLELCPDCDEENDIFLNYLYGDLVKK